MNTVLGCLAAGLHKVSNCSPGLPCCPVACMHRAMRTGTFLRARCIASGSTRMPTH